MKLCKSWTSPNNRQSNAPLIPSCPLNRSVPQPSCYIVNTPCAFLWLRLTVTAFKFTYDSPSISESLHSWDCVMFSAEMLLLSVSNPRWLYERCSGLSNVKFNLGAEISMPAADPTQICVIRVSHGNSCRTARRGHLEVNGTASRAVSVRDGTGWDRVMHSIIKEGRGDCIASPGGWQTEKKTQRDRSVI